MLIVLQGALSLLAVGLVSGLYDVADADSILLMKIKNKIVSESGSLAGVKCQQAKIIFR